MTNPQTIQTTDDRPVLRLIRTFQTPREAVFDAFTKPDELAKWWGPKGMTTPVAEIDLRVGGAYRFDMAEPGGNIHRLTGVFREVQRPQKLVYTWIWEQGDMAGVESLVTIDFADLGAATELTLTHELLPSERACELHEQGWTSSFDCLDETLTGA
ncbi:MAG: SRPBCC domain-containing protein [Rhodospirillales bacterium]|mgnify:FL=1|jgi:uncharacterized protein YndB with AHSA1/START domain|nr:SRPBCC domain-containing protein [Rhodospirillales bacterium]MDP6804571.1 SRPBCC domain-containing protein [Rhodospirillales bacterium]